MRESIRDGESENLNMRQLAKVCGVSVPTLYSHFKDKNTLLLTAADEIFRWHFEKIVIPAWKPGLDQILHIADATGNLILQNPELSRMMIKTNPAKPSSSSRLVARALYQKCLQNMQRQGEIADWLSLSFFSERVYYRVRSVSMEWAWGVVPDRAFQSLRRCEIVIALLGFSSEALSKRLRSIWDMESIRAMQ